MKIRTLLQNLFQLTVNLFKKKMLRNLRIVDLMLIFLGQMGHTLNKKKKKSQKFGTRWD